MVKRRSFIKTAGVIAAGTLLAPSHAFGNRKKKRVIILGAGLAGLTAAYRLQQLGYGVSIVESKGRLGGRVLTYRPDPEQPLTVEMGGEWIGSSHHHMRKLVEDVGLKLVDHTFQNHLLFKAEHFRPGNWDLSDKGKASLRSLVEKYNSLKPDQRILIDKTDWWRYLRNSGFESRDLDLQELMDSNEYGESIRQVSALMALGNHNNYGAKMEMDYRIEGGNQRLIDELAERIGWENIHLNQPVTRVRQNPGGVRVFTYNGTLFEADKVICALPVLAIRKIDWDPGFSDDKKEALNSLQYSRITKTAFLFKERFWRDDQFGLLSDAHAHYIYHATRGQSGTHGVLMSHSIGDNAQVLGGASEAYRIKILNQALDPLFGPVDKSLLKQSTLDWSRDPIVMGAVALYGPGQVTSVMPELKQDMHNVHFCGEHLGDWQGFMEGAVQSAYDVAEQIVI